MTDQINKIIFTTKEAYDEKKKTDTLEQDVVYAIDASQAVTTTEVKTAVDNGFEKFGLSLGIDEEKAKFYNLPISLADMIKDIVIEKFNNTFSGNYKRACNGTREFMIGILSNKNTSIKAIQDGQDHGFVKFTVYNDQDFISPAKVIVPESIDITKEFTLKISNIFDTSSCEITVYPNYEPIAIELLDELINSINFDQAANGLDEILLYTNSNKVDAVSMMMTNHLNAIIPTDYDDLVNLGTNSMKESDNSANVLFVDYTFGSYVDLATGTWKQFPESVKDKVKKLSDRYTETAKQKLGI